MLHVHGLLQSVMPELLMMSQVACKLPRLGCPAPPFPVGLGGSLAR